MAALSSARHCALADLVLLLAIPEYQVDLPGGQRPSQIDVLALMRGKLGLVVVAVEGKVDERFGPTVGAKRADSSPGVAHRLAYLLGRLAIESAPDTVRYQLLHRAVSALLVAEQFDAAAAVMLVHSFSPDGRWFDDFEVFAALFGAQARVGTVVPIGDYGDTPLLIGWCKGDQRLAGGSSIGIDAGRPRQ